MSENIKYILIMLICLIAAPAAARDVEFSWIQNSEKELTGYRLYCDPKTNVELDGTDHKYRKLVPKGADIAAGDRRHYAWVDFPEARQYCVCVAQGLYGAEKRHSEFSKEVEVPAYVPVPVAPTEFKFEISGTVKLIPVK